MNTAVKDKQATGAERSTGSDAPGDYASAQDNVVACTLPRPGGARPEAFGSLSEQVVQAVFDGLDDPLFVLDANGRVLTANAPAMTYVGQGSDLISWQDILSLADTGSEALARAWLALNHQDAVQIECGLHRRASEEVIAAEVRLRNILVRGRTLRLVTVRDISEHKSRENRLRRLASVDDLTQVANRRHFMALLDRETGRARRYGHAVALLMVDADHFKAINDRYGHETGDRALQLLARVARKACRAADVVGRVGGEEFAILLPETRIEKALHVAERIRLTVAQTSLMVGSRALHMTVSIGASAACGAECDSQELLQRADMALYTAKNQGRDRVVADEHALDQAARPCAQRRLRSGSDRR